MVRPWWLNPRPLFIVGMKNDHNRQSQKSFGGRFERFKRPGDPGVAGPTSCSCWRGPRNSGTESEMVKNLERMKKCPRFSYCSIPKCPLDKDVDLCVKLPGELSCTLPKSRRMRLGKDLPWEGMTKREFAGYQAWKKRSQKLRSETFENLRRGRVKLGIAQGVWTWHPKTDAGYTFEDDK